MPCPSRSCTETPRTSQSYEEEDTCQSYEEEDTCTETLRASQHTTTSIQYTFSPTIANKKKKVTNELSPKP
jgi:hypothetical protein